MADRYFPDFLPKGQMENSTWLTLKPKKVIKANMETRKEGGSVDTVDDNTVDTYHFLMPTEISFDISHDWKDYASVIGVIREISSGIKNARGQVTPLEDFFKEVFANRSDWKNSLNKLKKGQIDIKSISNKNDNSIIYENSKRKTLAFDILLSTYSDPKKEVFDPVQDLMKLSSPDAKPGEYIEYMYPYIFELSVTVNGETRPLVFINKAALVTVHAEFIAPYIKGYPSKAEIQLVFEDIDPLYRSTSWLYKAPETKFVTTKDTSKEVRIKDMIVDEEHRVSPELYKRLLKIRSDNGILEAKNARYLLYGVGYITVPPTVPIPPIL